LKAVLERAPARIAGPAERPHRGGVAPALLALVLAASEPPVPPREAEPRVEVGEGWHFAALPIFSYGSDVGLTLGAALYFYKLFPDRSQERQSANLAFSYATRGPRSLDSGWNVRRIGGTSLHTLFNLHLGDDPLMPYWGEGAQLGGLPFPPGWGTPPPPYRYHDRRVFASGTLQGAFVGPFGWHLRARYLFVDVVEQSALLAESSPPGARGGRVALGEVGLLLDARDREINTHRGLYASVTAFLAPQIHGVSDFAFHGWDATVRVYVPLWSGATIAARGLYDRKLAGTPLATSETSAVPFFERMLYEGTSNNEGLGGSGTIRGVARFRISGDEKLLGNAQLRVTVLSTHLFDKLQEYGLDVGVDAGLARQAGYPQVDAGSVALGLRIVWDRALAVRVEAARARGGETGWYIALGEMF
jgi:hypothetical protein